MGKADRKQTKLMFDQRRQDCMTDPTADNPVQDQAGGESSTQEPDRQAMFLSFKHSLTAIDTKVYLVTNRFDRLKEKVDRHNEFINKLESHMSAVEDESTVADEKLQQMEQVLDVIISKNKDSEVRSQRNNLSIMGFSESIAMDCINDYVKAMLHTLFGSSFPSGL
ncbi:hypothetical protein NDU88_006325 [Pleurodeles waltl]|uniref:Uncharacterized protein n=1 Tax=Pleurodeles waltl TaxID=8319 RepID=A0AAV7N209_PLEWA|nr:hypothetical protein NDU88_006325 [Pleurodeles waltl]